MGNKLVVITGGIGSGKSVVSEILRLSGYKVYDCDSEAKRLMNTSEAIKTDLIEKVGAECVNSDGTINKAYLGSRIFTDKNVCQVVNGIVHPRVKADVARFKAENGSLCFCETAILKESNMADIADEVWVVTAPVDVRVERVMRRNSCTADEVRRRIDSQNNDWSWLEHYSEIANDGINAVLPRVEALLRELSTQIVH